MIYGGGITCVKYLLFFFNFMFWLSGVALIAVGAVVQIRYSAYINFLGDSYFAAPVLLMITGCIVAMIGFFGCCGAIRENYCMSMTFAILLGSILILELGAAVAGYILRGELGSVIKTQAVNGMSHYNMTGSNGVTDAWDNLQQNFHCCGVTNYTDWQNNTWFENNNDVPVSCCRKDIVTCYVDVRNEPVDVASDWIYTEPCADKLQAWADGKMGVIIASVCVIGFIQVIGISLACIFGTRIHDAYDAI